VLHATCLRLLSLVGVLLGLALTLPVPAEATTIAWWRMEEDLDPDPDGLRVANEFAGGSDLVSSEAFVDLAANPNGTVPLTGTPNLGSVGATMQGSENGINATAAWYPELDVSSISLEFWARTGENVATLFSRTSGGADGLVIGNPNSLDVTYYVSDGAGGAVERSLVDVFDMDDAWRHYAFVYDETTGIGTFFVDGVAVASDDGPDGRPLVWGTAVPVQLGPRMDFAAAFNGTLDEVRIRDTSSGPLLIPEPGASLLVLAVALRAGRRSLRARCRHHSTAPRP